MAYQVRAKRRDDGGYDLSYGKGQKKVVATVVRDPANGKWFVDVLGHRQKLADIKKDWGTWAATRFEGASKAKRETAPIGPAQTPSPSPMRQTQGGDHGLKVYASNPNDPRFKYPTDIQGDNYRKRGHSTPLGMLLEVQAWHERYRDRVDKINQVLAAERTPGFNPFSFLRMMIDECIERECPNEFSTKDGSDDSDPAV
jgi:hypothetical protein